MLFEQNNFLYYYNNSLAIFDVWFNNISSCQISKATLCCDKFRLTKKENVKRKQWVQNPLILQMYHKGIFLCCTNKMKCLCQWWKQKCFSFYRFDFKSHWMLGYCTQYYWYLQFNQRINQNTTIWLLLLVVHFNTPYIAMKSASNALVH